MGLEEKEHLLEDTFQGEMYLSLITKVCRRDRLHHCLFLFLEPFPGSSKLLELSGSLRCSGLA